MDEDQVSSKEKVAETGRPTVFVSHSHADRKLAQAVRDLIQDVFSGIVTPFISSDPGPAGGIMPGEEWYPRIEAVLREAEAVWVLATPTAVARPWIYWEAGIGRALCPKGVVILCVGLTPGDVPSPLSSFQGYDGTSETGVHTLVDKVATQLRMKIPTVLAEDCAKKWTAAARGHQPETSETTEREPHLSPERLDRLDAAIARLERLGRPTRPLGPSPRATAPFAPLDELIYALPTFLAAVDAVHTTVVFEASGIDNDGDAHVRVRRGDDETNIWLRHDDIPQLLDAELTMLTDSARTLDLLQQIRGLALAEQASDESTPAE